MAHKTPFYFIVNPTGGGGKAIKAWQKLKSELESEKLAFEYKFTEAKWDGINCARLAINEGFTHLIAVGGDGTAHEVANGILQEHALNKDLDISMSLFSCGTGNDWVKEHKITRDPKMFVQQLKTLNYKTQDVGLVHFYQSGTAKSCYLMNVTGLAYDAFVAMKCENKKNGYWAGRFYLFYVFKLLFQYKPEKAKIKLDNKEWDDIVYSINIGKCRYSGGNMQLVPHAVPDDGFLAVTVASALPKWEVILQTAKFYNGKIGQHPKIQTLHCKTIEIKSLDKKEILLEVDGEYLGNTPVKIEIVENALKVFGFSNQKA